MKKFIKVRKAFSAPNRIKIMKILQHRAFLCVRLKSSLVLPNQQGSKHLKLLEDAVMVRRCEDGLWVNYFYAADGDFPYEAYTIGNLKHGLDTETEIKKLTGWCRESTVRILLGTNYF